MEHSEIHKSARGHAWNSDGMKNQKGNPRLLVRPNDVVTMLDLSARKVWQLTKDGALPSAKIGTRTVYPVAGLHAWIAAGCPTEPGSAATLKWTTGGEA